MVQNSKSFKSIMSGFFERTRALTYLDLSDTAINNLPREIGLLANLRYLNLSETNIHSLPLQLELSRLCGNLKGVGIVLESIEDLHKVAQFRNVLMWRLELTKLKGFNEPLQLLSTLLCGSRNICSSIQILKIRYCESLEVVLMESDGYSDIQKRCLSRLEQLDLHYLMKLKEVVWRGVCPRDMLPSLTMLNIFGCQDLTNISWVIRLPSLEKLTVNYCRQMQQIIDDDSEFAHYSEEENGVGTAGLAFPSLRSLFLSSLPSLRVFVGSFTFPSLELLLVRSCPKMNTLPFGAKMAGKKLKTIRGVREWWENLNMEDDARVALEPYFSL